MMRVASDCRPPRRCVNEQEERRRTASELQAVRVREEIEAEEAAAAALRATAEGGHKRVSFTYARGRSSRRPSRTCERGAGVPVLVLVCTAGSMLGGRTEAAKLEPYPK